MTIGASNSVAAGRRIRLGMVGGGEGAFIGAVHRIAARLDDHYELVAGALASDPARAKRSALALGLADDRSYADYAAMAKAEGARADGIEAVAIVTPNHLHAPVAEAFLKAGIHVICDKPLATSVREARRLQALAAKHDRLFAVTYNYTGYPMVRQARQMVQEGRLGEIRVVQVEYAQDWLTEPLEDERPEAGRLAHRPRPRGRGRLHRRHRHACLPARRLRRRAAGQRAVRRAQHLRRRPPPRRQRPGDAALRRRRARRALGKPGRARATRTTCACASMAAAVASSGTRSSRTSSPSRRSASRRRRSRAPAARPAPRRRA
jgi:hypothetical protein